MMGSKRRTPIGGVDGARDRRLRGRTFAVAVLLLAIAAMGARAEAQPAARVPKVGLLLPTTAAAAGYNVEALKQGLREAGYVEGKTIALEIRYGEGRFRSVSDTCPGARKSQAGRARDFHRSG